ncbi:hypothetical protein AB4Y30_07655 [Ornithinibacillus sp. 4-3]|uniref:Uncharacterized protein n=1 Tax=Ornithinibacillus sp. 4-3 TaxID=3231488 RepID=A0AB39HV85_9BACI
MKKWKHATLLSVIAGGLATSSFINIVEANNDSNAEIIEAIETVQQEYTEITGDNLELDSSVIAEEEAQEQYQEELEQSLEAIENVEEEITELAEELVNAQEKEDEKAVAQIEAQVAQKQTQQVQIAAMGSNLNGLDLSSMDLETALMHVQTQRTQLLDTQLKEQLQAVQARNDEVARLHEQIRLAQEANDKALEESLNRAMDVLHNTQQMDMLRLQSLSNKRNEAFDLMTNFIKKMQESRSSIIGNMR